MTTFTLLVTLCLVGSVSASCCEDDCTEGQGCSEKGACKGDLYCDTDFDFLKDCVGVCLRTKSDVCNKKDTEDLCQGKEALAFAIAAYSPEQSDTKYTPVGKLKEWKTHTTTTEVFDNKILKRTGITGKPSGFTAYRGSTVVVAFKGTSNPTTGDEKGVNVNDIQDVVVDFDFFSKDFVVENKKSGEQPMKFRAHGGFVEYYQAIKQSVFDEVARMKKAGHFQEILVSGHSLGGAMATLCAVELAATYPDVKVSLWTYASPRVFSHPPSSAYKAYQMLTNNGNSHHRYVVDGDLIPQVPLIQMGYLHCGDGLQLGKIKGTDTDTVGCQKHCGIECPSSQLQKFKGQMNPFKNMPFLKDMSAFKKYVIEEFTKRKKFHEKENYMEFFPKNCWDNSKDEL